MLLNGRYHRMIYTGSLMLIAVSLPLTIFSTSVAQFILLGNWLAEGEFTKKWQRLKSRPAFLVFMGLYLLHLVGMLWTNNLNDGLKDLQIKVPLLMIPLIAGSCEFLTKGELRRIFLSFTIGVVIASFASILAMARIIPVDPGDYRNYSLFISHIRFSLMIVLAWSFAVNYIFIEKGPWNKAEHIFYIFSVIWLPVFLVFLRSLSGLLIFILLIFILGLYRILRMKDPVTKFMLLVFLLLIPLLSVLYVEEVIKDYYTVDLIDVNDLDSLTIEGNPYLNQTWRMETENGHFVWLYVCKPELMREWNKVSDIDFDGRDLRGQRLRLTLIRYMTSLNLRKDAAGFRQLTPADIRAVENGTTNVIYNKKYSLYPRIYELVWEMDTYRKRPNPNNHSVVQRMYYLDAGWHIARQHLLFGVGTGDIPDEFRAYYEKVNSPLTENRRRRAHNQYLTFAIAFGIPGFVIAMFTLIWPVIKTKRWRFFVPFVFLFTMALSMLNEDTLETSAGATPFALFYVLLILNGISKEEEKEEEKGLF